MVTGFQSSGFDGAAWLLQPRTAPEWEQTALEVFRHQAAQVPVYKNYVELLDVAPESVQTVEEIPFLPITFFKQHRVATGDQAEAVFTSSGTTGAVPSSHYVQDLALYEASFTTCFERQYGPAAEWCFLCLLPAYLERQGSSLVHMADTLIQRSNYDQSGFYLDNLTALLTQVRDNEALGIPTVLLGVSFALMDFADLAAPLPLQHTVVMETGGMKGRREELTKEALHAYLQHRLHTPTIHSEYGMTELLSQAYSKGNGRFSAPDWMRVYPRELRDPFAPVQVGRSGVLRILDLANLHSCAFIETQDLGRCHADGTFEVLGRVDFSDVRGCNLMVD